MRALFIVLGAIVAIPIAAIATVLVGIRFRVEPILNALRRFNRDVTNPRALHTANDPGSARTVVHHVGRRSGKPYATPIDTFETGRGTLVAALPYGPDTDWVRNIRAAGRADLVRQGRDLRATDPQVVATADVLGDLPTSARRALGLFNVENCLELRVATAP